MEIKSGLVGFNSENSDYGTCFNVTCPTCQQTVVVTQTEWPGPKCLCGYHWSVSLTAVGMKDEEITP